MKTRILLFLLLLASGQATAQWTVFDPSNLTQSIVNSTNEMVETATTAEHMIKNFQETVKIYNQQKEYYDKLRKVNSFIKNARKVQRCMLLVGEITDIYMRGYNLMVRDNSFTTRELSAIAYGYCQLLQESSYCLKDLKTIINPTDLSMTDKDRLDLVDKAYNDLTGYRDLANYYTNKNIHVSLLRAREKGETERVLSLYGNDREKYW